jgi:hypothetical protein
MELYSTPEGRSPEKGAKLRPESGASLLPAGEQAEHSVAEMAQRDLDTALQLLANRAQYITGASGAAIALRRDGKNDMLCRASTGSNAPELGALLSTEAGLSGESVRTRQMLRCDDAERDVRVNREVCRQLGIASVVVMPVVNDDEVLGVFELFSGKANAFGARDVSAVQRLSEMVETAVRLAQATADLPERLKLNEVAATGVKVAVVEPGEVGEDQVLDGEVLADVVLEETVPADIVLEEALVEESVPVEGKPVVAVFVEERFAGEELAAKTPTISAGTPTLSQRTRKDGAPSVDAASSPVGASSAEETAATTKKKLYWSAASTSAGDASHAAEPDQSHVPPVLRSLRKCEACGFPISAGRVLCVECEEKKWRGHLKAPKMVGPRPAVIPSPFAASVSPAAKPEARAFAAAAQSTGVSARAAVPGFGTNLNAAVSVSREKESKEVARPVIAAPPLPAAQSAALPEANPAISAGKSEFVLSAGLEPSQSWLSANKFVIGVLLAIGGGAAALFFLR